MTYQPGDIVYVEAYKHDPYYDPNEPWWICQIIYADSNSVEHTVVDLVSADPNSLSEDSYSYSFEEVLSYKLENVHSLEDLLNLHPEYFI